MDQIINLLGKIVKVYSPVSGKLLRVIEPSKLPIPKIKYDRSTIEDGSDGNKIPLYDTRIKKITNLPDKINGLIYLVYPPIKRITKEILHRNDFITAVKVSDASDDVISCQGFSY